MISWELVPGSILASVPLPAAPFPKARPARAAIPEPLEPGPLESMLGSDSDSDSRRWSVRPGTARGEGLLLLHKPADKKRKGTFPVF